MTARITKFTVACLMLLFSRTASAQVTDAFCEPICYSDAQYFAPVDFDFDCRPIRKDCGFFFNYEKLAWVATGERHHIGVEGATQAGSFNSLRQFVTGETLQIGNPVIPNPGVTVFIDPPLLPNNIQNAEPRADLGWGERYELGYFKGDAGWLVGVLDGPEIDSSQVYGFGATVQDGTNGLLSPLGSVFIVFDDPLNLMRGFIDVFDGVPTAGPPGGNLQDDTNGDGILDGDGFADDIDRDGHFGPDGVDLDDPVEEPDAGFVGGLEHDFDDLVILPVSFQTLVVRNRTEISGIELMRTHRLDNRHRMAKHQNRSVVMSYGVRYVQLDDQFRVDGAGGVLGDSFWDTSIINNIVGPQLGLSYQEQKGRFLFDFNGRFLFGYNIQNLKQTAALGEDLIPGQHNHPLYFSPTYANHGRQEEDFAPVVELRANASYQLTGAIALKLGYTGTFIDNIRRASQHVKYELPRMGFRDDAGTQNIFVNGVNFGAEVVY